MKKYFSLFLCLILLFGLLPLAAPARADSSGDWEYEITDGKATITNYTGSGGKVTIPSTLGGKPVCCIGRYAFYGCSSVTSVTIPDSVTNIGDQAFSGCTGLTSVTIPSSVTSIGYRAFYGCTGLTSVTIPKSVTSIGDAAFTCCTGLTSMTIPSGVISVGSYAFESCTGLISVSIPDSVTEIGSSAFYECSKLTKINVASDNSAYCSVDGVLFNKDKTVLFAFPGGRSGDYSIPDSVTTIYTGAFYGCTGLTYVTIPNSVTGIDNRAFDGCSNLTGLAIGNGVTRISSYAFRDCTSLTRVDITDLTAWCSIGFGTYYSNPLMYAHMLYLKGEAVTELVIPDSVREIGENAFMGWSGLMDVTIHDKVTSIGDNAFDGCSGLTELVIPDSVTSIGSYAFADCTGLTYMRLPDRVTSVPWGAFSGCTRLISVAIPNGVTRIALEAFDGCSSLTELTIPDSVTSIERCAFSGCTSLTELTIPDKVTSIETCAFSNCTGLTSINIPKSVTHIGSFAFQGCTGLTQVDITDLAAWCAIEFYKPDGNSGNPLEYAHALYLNGEAVTELRIPDNISSIGRYAFHNCTGLTSVTIPDSVTDISREAFFGCSGLTSVTIGSGAANIGHYAFFECSSLTSVTIGSGVTSIGGFAFSRCTSLTGISIPDSVTKIENGAFSGCTGLTSVTIPDNVTSIGKWAFEGCTGLADVYYGGTEEDWGKIYIDWYNDPLTSATIHYAGPLGISSVKANKTSAKTGDAITWTATASGGAGTLQYYFILYKNGAKVKTQAYSTKNTFSYTPEEPGTYKVKAYVKDAADTKVDKTSTGVTVTEAAAALTIDSVKADVGSAKTGEKITWTATASGGAGTLQYSFILYKNGAKVKTQAYSTKNTFSYAPKGAGTFKVKVYVKDAEGTKVYKTSIDVTVTSSSAGPVISSVKAGVTCACAGEKITWTATASGGSGTLQYFFFLYKDGVKIKNQAYSTKNTFSYTPTEAGSYKVKVYVKDSNEAKAYKTSGKIAVTLGPPAIISVKAGKTSSAVGEKITWTAKAVGSEHPLKYYFILYKDGVKVKTRSYSTTNTFSYTPTESGIYKVKVYVKDAEGTKVYKNSAKITVTG